MVKGKTMIVLAFCFIKMSMGQTSIPGSLMSCPLLQPLADAAVEMCACADGSPAQPMCRPGCTCDRASNVAAAQTYMSFPYMYEDFPLKIVGAHTAMMCEASDAAISGALVEDGESGDTDFPFGTIKVLATVGEYNPKTGWALVGVPDGMGAYLLDDDTVRVVFQSESYGPVSAYESYPFIVNDNGATFTGSHVLYVDYDRYLLADFMSHSGAAKDMVKDSGNLIKNVYNLAGKMVSARPRDGGCAEAPHYSNTDPEGCGDWVNIMAAAEPMRSVDWLLQSLCSAHLEEKHQWGPDLGVEDDLFITNEEWTSFVAGANFTGIPAHVLDLASKDFYATGVFTLGGFEKIVEVNCGIPGYVCFSPSGYNGAFGVAEPLRQELRPDGMPYVWPENIVPARLYIGKKGFNAKGEEDNENFLSRNGLAYGQLYGYGVMNGTMDRDAWHRQAANGDVVEGAFYPLEWRWDGEVKNFLYDGCWAFQHPVDNGTGHFWTANGPDSAGSKTEHNTPDPTGLPRFIQSSTAGYLGIYDFAGVADLIADDVNNGGEGFPTKIPSVYTNLQGEVDVTAQIMLGGKGQYAHGGNATQNYDGAQEAGLGKRTFEDIDGIEWFASSSNDMGYLLIQEDSGNDYGERTFIAPVSTTEPMTYYFVAMSGGDKSTRNGPGMVGVPKGTNAGGGAHEFSGSMDLSGMLAKDVDGNFIVQAGTGQGYATRQAEKMTAIDDKIIAMGLQAHNLHGGVIRAYNGDRGGQLFAYQPKLL